MYTFICIYIHTYKTHGLMISLLRGARNCPLSPISPTQHNTTIHSSLAIYGSILEVLGSSVFFQDVARQNSYTSCSR